mgnify:CR=1 FL=1
MIHAEYVEFDLPTGARVRRLEVYGHACYAPAGQDIVCAAASMLMETLVYVLADCEEAECCAYSEPTGPRVSVKLTGGIYEADLAALEFAKTGLGLLAERYPANVRFEDKSKDGQAKMVDLQLFAEGGDGAGDGSAGGEGEAAPAAVEEPKLRPAEERLARRSGTLKRGNAASGAPSQAAEAASSPKGGALGNEAGSDLDTEEGKDEAPANEKGEEEKKTDARTPEERKAAFHALLEGEYREETEELMQRAVERAADLLESSPAVKDLMSALHEAYGVDPDDLPALTEAVRSGRVKDNAYYEKLAMEKGVSVETARQMDKLESENKRLSAAEQFAEEQRKAAQRQAEIRQIHAQWDREAQQLKAQYPQFDLQEVLANPEVSKLMRLGVSMPNAYRSVYFDQIMAEQMGRTAKQVEQGVVARQEQRSRRPAENGVNPGGAVQAKFDVAHMSRREAEDIEKRVARGEIITF